MEMLTSNSDLLLKQLGRALKDSSRDLAPIIGVIAVFKVLILRQPLPDLATTLLGLVFVVLGLALFVVGLEIGLFPLGESMAESFARKGSLAWLLVFAFALGEYDAYANRDSPRMEKHG